jgi:hypothetical protein
MGGGTTSACRAVAVEGWCRPTIDFCSDALRAPHLSRMRAPKAEKNFDHEHEQDMNVRPCDWDPERWTLCVERLLLPPLLVARHSLAWEG